MKLISDPDDSFSADPSSKDFQIQKVYIKKLEDTDKLEPLEKELKDYFSAFGTVIDIKTLRNSRLISQKRPLRLRYLPGRGIGTRSTQCQPRVS